MAESRRQSLAVLHRVAEFLQSLPEQHIAELEEGTARLTLIPAGQTQPLVPASPRTPTPRTKPAPFDMTATINDLHRVETRDQARALLKPLRKDKELKDLASQLGMYGFGSLGKDQLVEAIVERTVGNRIDSAAIRSVERVPV